MSIYSLLRKLENKINEWINVSENIDKTSESKSSTSDTSISDSLCSKNINSEDTYESSNIDKNTKIPKSEQKENRKKIKEDFNLDWIDRAWYVVANYFNGDYSIVEKAEKYIDDSTSIEEAIDKLVAEEYDGLKNEKDYKKYRKRYGLGLLNLDSENKKEADCMAASIAQFKVEDRVNALKSLIGIGQTVGEKCNLARLGQSHALSIVTKKDPLSGEAPDSKFAFDFQKLTYENMDKAGISASNLERDKKADEVVTKYKTLMAKGDLTPDEQAWLDKNKIIYDNYIVSGYSGALAGITTNMYISDADAQVFMSSISATVQNHGIQTEVFSQVDEYLANNPSSAYEPRRAFLANIETQIMQSTQPSRNMSQGNTHQTSSASNSTNQEMECTASMSRANSQIDFVTNPISNNSTTEVASAANGSNENISTHHTHVSSPNMRDISDKTFNSVSKKQLNTENKSAPSAVEKHEALLSPEAYKEYMKEYDIDTIHACKDILNDATDNRLIAYGLELFATVLSEADREDLVSNSNGLDDKGKARAAKVSSIHIINKIKVNDVWAQEQIAATKKERMEKLGIKEDYVKERNAA